MHWWHCWHDLERSRQILTHNGLSTKQVIDQTCCNCGNTRTVKYDGGW